MVNMMINLLGKKTLVKLNIFLVFILFAFSAVAAEPHKSITGEELQALMKDAQPVKIVDVRELELFKSGHVPGAINIPYDTAHNRILKELSPKDRVVFICHGGPMGDELGGRLPQKRGRKGVKKGGGGRRERVGEDRQERKSTFVAYTP